MATTHYTWDRFSDNVLMESDENGDTTAVYTNEPGQYGQLVSQHRGNTTSYYQFDGQGSTRQLTDDTETVTDTATFTAFGEEVASSGATTNPFGYKGAVGYYANPETDDLYVRARTYQPSIGRWLSVDPLGFAGGDVNLARYVGNNSPNHVDPAGTEIPIFVPEAMPLYTTPKPAPPPPFAATITISPAGTTGGKTCQSVNSRRMFSIDKAPCYGYFAQRILYACYSTKCCCETPAWKYKTDKKTGNPIFDHPGAESYWLFEVFKPAIAKGAAGKLANPDQFATGSLQGTCGLLNMYAEVMFICEQDLFAALKVNNTFQLPQKPLTTTRCGAQHTSNPWTWEKPAEVQALRISVQRTRKRKHQFQRQWRCCHKDPQKNFDTFAEDPKPSG